MNMKYIAIIAALLLTGCGNVEGGAPGSVLAALADKLDKDEVFVMKCQKHPSHPVL